jgi:hypothetical protein
MKDSRRMARELKAGLSVAEMQIIRGTTYFDEAYLVLATADTHIPGEVRAKYFRDLGISTVHADVHVDAIGDSSFRLHAVVQVNLIYRGDMVRSSERTKRAIGDRLQELAQGYCAKMAHKEILKTTE